MLQIKIQDSELWDERKQEFVYVKRQTLQLEHSLISISKWESKWCKSFFHTYDKTYEEVVDYIRCMVLTPKFDPLLLSGLTVKNIEDINEYINAPMTATYFSENNHRFAMREKITSELIYYWLIELNIPFECQKWHINRLLTLIRLCSLKKQPPRKMSRGEIIRRNAALNEERRKSLNTKG